MNLDHLIELAKLTGDRLIVHDPFAGRDMVIMNVDEYERLVMAKKSERWYGGNVRGMESEQLLDRINRDIAVWRADREMEENRHRSLALEDELVDSSSPGPLAEDFYHRPEWHAVGDVLDERYDFDRFDVDRFDVDRFDVDRIDRHIGSDIDEAEGEMPNWPFANKEKRWKEDDWNEEEGWEDEEESSWGTETRPVAMKDEEVGEVREETLLGEEPVFYEEPV